MRRETHNLARLPKLNDVDHLLGEHNRKTNPGNNSRQAQSRQRSVDDLEPDRVLEDDRGREERRDECLGKS